METAIFYEIAAKSRGEKMRRSDAVDSNVGLSFIINFWVTEKKIFEDEERRSRSPLH